MKNGILNPFAVLFVILLATTGAFAQSVASVVQMKMQSEPFVLLKGNSQSVPIHILYGVKGEDPDAWTVQFEIKGHKGATPAELARKEALDTLARQKTDRYAAALLMASRSGDSVFVDQVKTVNGSIESSMVRYFKKTNGQVVSFRFTRRLMSSRLPADETQAKGEVVRFLEREKVRRADLIVDLSKKEMPHQTKDDPMGLQGFPLRPKQTH